MPSKSSEPVRLFSIPEEAYDQLLRVRNQLQLIAALTEPRTRAEADEPVKVSAAALAEGLNLVAGELDRILEAVQ